jgi:hypothetical protein
MAANSPPNAGAFNMGTAATSTLLGLCYRASTATVVQTSAMFAQIGALIADDYTGALQNNAFAMDGHLYIPRRGVLKILPGDFVCVDNTGWPVLISPLAQSGSSPQWIHT